MELKWVELHVVVLKVKIICIKDKFGSHTHIHTHPLVLFDLHLRLEVGGVKVSLGFLLESVMSPSLPKPRFPRDDCGSRPNTHPLKCNPNPNRCRKQTRTLFCNSSLHINGINWYIKLEWSSSLSSWVGRLSNEPSLTLNNSDLIARV